MSATYPDFSSMYADLERIMITTGELDARLGAMGAEITRDYAGKPLVLVGILKGCLIFMADLSRRLPFPHSFDMVGASSYGKSTTSSGHVTITKDVDVDLAGKHILVTEDIYDSGRTLRVVIDLLRLHQPASIEVCALLVKECASRACDVPVKYEGFRIPDEFVVGYGLDYNEKYRNLPCIGILKQSVYQTPGK